ncbi:hypothetical protein OSTOST_22976, partial [Ostertagia ostertagi]
GGAPDEPLLPPEDHVREGIVFEYLNYYEGGIRKGDFILDMIMEGLAPRYCIGERYLDISPADSLARAAAAKDLVDKCFRVGLISEVLHTAIGNHPFFKKRDLPRRDYDLAMDALINLDEKISVGKVIWLCIERIFR